jgi:hypothetical protein
LIEESIRLVLLALVVMPTTELVLPFNVDGHSITPTTPDPTPLVPLPFLSSNLQQLQQQVPWMLIPVVPMPLPSSAKDRHQQWGWSDAQ